MIFPTALSLTIIFYIASSMTFKFSNEELSLKSLPFAFFDFYFSLRSQTLYRVRYWRFDCLETNSTNGNNNKETCSHYKNKWMNADTISKTLEPIAHEVPGYREGNYQ